MQTNAHRRAQRGITLIELMIVVAIVAILGSIAVASYRSNVLKSNRAEAKSALLRLQAAQEKYYLNANEYAATLADLNLPAATERGLYSIELDTDDDLNGYEAVATADGRQVDDDECPEFSIDHTGKREPDPAASRCWQ